MSPCDKSALHCLAPVTSQEATPLLINAEQAAEIIHDTWSTTTASCIYMATAKDQNSLSLSQCKITSVGAGHISL